MIALPFPTRLLFVWLCIASFVASSAALAQDAEKPQILAMRLGFGGTYKLGSWTPVEVDLQGGSEPMTGVIVVTAPDTDGVPTSVVSPPSRPVGLTPLAVSTARLFVRIGKSQSPVRVQFIADGKLRAERKFKVDMNEVPDGQILAGGLPATNRLLIQFGPTIGMGSLVRSSEEAHPLVSTVVKQLERAEELPTKWYGYEGVDTVFLSTSDPQQYRPLLQSTARTAALYQWVQQGGHLVLFCGQSAEELLGNDGVLARFAPGSFESMQPLRQSLPLESFSGSDEPITRNRRLSIDIPKLNDVQGEVLLAAGREESELPLIVRSRLGLGEVVFCGLDVDRPPLAAWKGRNAFLRRALGWPSKEGSKQSNNSNLYEQPEDMSSILRTALDVSFAGITPVPFFLVGALVVGYILLIGPGDYLLVSRVLKRAELTWVTFPLIVVGVSAAAYFLAYWLKGDQFRVNQVEVVDVVAETGQLRGTVWTHFYTPRVDKYDLSIEPAFLGKEAPTSAKRFVSWLGLPGNSPGGMQEISAQDTIFDRGYAYSPALTAMQDLPIQLWSTKTITSNWQAEVVCPIDSELVRSGGELVRGQFTNNSEVVLRDSLLLYGNWAYHLGNIPPEGVTIVNDDTQPKTVKTSLTNATAGDVTEHRTAEDGTVHFHTASTDVSRLLKAMMFFDAINGKRYTNGLNRYQSAIDLSHLLKQRNLAILLCRIESPGSRWLNGDAPLRSEHDKHWTYYRFVLPVEDTDP